MDPHLFLADVRRKPESLDHLADVLSAGDPWAGISGVAPGHVVLLGMGSSLYAAGVAAARLRHRGIRAIAEWASTDLLPDVDRFSLVIAVSATGRSRETLAAAARYRGRCTVVALTEDVGSPLAQQADVAVALEAGEERGGVACVTFAHTIGLLLALEVRWCLGGRDVGALLRTAADSTRDLVDRAQGWLPDLTAAVAGPSGTHVVAPARRFGSAQQSALMLREGPRRAAVACETGDWSHVDVYLTKTTDYRMLLLAGSRWEPGLLDWTAQRGTTVVAVGADVPGATSILRYRGDADDDVRLLTETTVAELVAARLWTGSPDPA